MKPDRNLLAVLAALCMCGCTSSLVYSPSVMLPSSPLKKEHAQMIASVEMLPETRPLGANRYSVIGGAGTLRYAFSDNVTAGIKGWSELGSNDEHRGGFSVEGIVMISKDSSSILWGVMPRGAIVFGNNLFSAGGGVALSAVAWFPVNSFVTPYAALGPAIGCRNENELGYGLIGNLGLTVRIVDGFEASLELAGVAQVNVYESVRSGVLAPGISVSGIF